jgi:ubiquinone/menaquinone biosynthesis C-methylase UbiE
MSTPDNFKSDDIRNWWNKQAKGNPESAGMLYVFGADKCSTLYRQAAEWHHFQRLASLKKTMRVLELGCGAGRWSLLMAPCVREVVAVDFSDEMIQLAQSRAEQAGLQNVQFIVGPVQEFMQSTPFDLIYLSSVDQYLDDAAFHETISHVRTMLAPGGRVVDRVTISTSERFFCDTEDSYKCLYRSLSDVQSVFSATGFEMSYHAPSHRQMRLPRLAHARPFMRFVEWMLQHFPRLGFSFIQTVTRIMNAIRPRPGRLVDRSHDFLVFQSRKEGA